MPATPDILFEDNHVLVALKAPNVLTQSDNTGDLDMLSLLKAYLKEKYQKPGDVFLGLVHRMDRPVGGLLCFARTSKAAARLSAQLRAGELNREYVCVCQGEAPDRFTLRDFLVKDEQTNMVRAVPAYLRQGKEAILHAQTICRRDGLSLVAVRLQTGRAHQIRAQLSHAGLPIAGDQRYGGQAKRAQIALWGMRLSMRHPVTQTAMVFVSAPDPVGIWEPFRRELDGLRAVWPQITPAPAIE